jgi:hypothetical protein
MLWRAISVMIFAVGCGDVVQTDPPPGSSDTYDLGVRCGTFCEMPAPKVEAKGDGYFPVDIGVRFVIFENGEQYGVPDSAIRNQLALLNEAFAGAAHFTLLSIDRINDRRCSTFKTESRCKRKARELHVDDGSDVLWLYTAHLGGELDGWATLPWSGSGLNDGVVVPVDDFPGTPAIHQVGHWLGIEGCAVEFAEAELARVDTLFSTFRL